MRIRQHRGSLDDSLATAAEIPATEEAVRSYFTKQFMVSILGEIEVKPYGYDGRVGWDTHVVMLDGSVAGFTDGPLVSKGMSSHALAGLLLTLPDLPVATHANNHTYMSKNDERSHGKLGVGLLETYGGPHIIIGNPWKRDINGPNWHISEMYLGEAS